MTTERSSALNEARRLRDLTGELQGLTIGEVVDTNDPQQMGRIRVACPILSELGDDPIDSIPWAMYMSPLAGTAVSPTRGRDETTTPGEIAYGMFNVPKVGSNVIIAFIDNDPRFRIWLGCVFGQYLTHTMPHGRYSYNTPEKPDGPFSSTEDKIQPLYDSQTNAFKRSATPAIDTATPIDEPRKTYEFRTRSADGSVGALDDDYVGNEESFVSYFADDFDVEYTEEDGNVIRNTQGYKKSRVENDATADNTKKGVLYDPQTYSWTTPGFHSVSMSDSADNCRVRFRTTHGHQIIMDDTNERIYVSTAGGKTWIEMDEAGNVDVYAERNLSFHAEQDINFTTEKAFRVKAKKGIHMISEAEMRLHAQTDMHIKANAKLELHTGEDFDIFNASNINIKSDGDFNIESVGAATIKAGSDLIMEGVSSISSTSGGSISGKAGGDFVGEAGGAAGLTAGANVLLTGVQIHFNGPPSPPAAGTPAPGAPPTAATTKDAYWTSRVPEHEPWARVMTEPALADDDVDNTHEPEFEYNSPDVGKSTARNEPPIVRNPKWHR